MKKIILGIGTIIAVATPVAITVSCSEEKVTSATINYHEMITKPDTAMKELWQYTKDSMTGVYQAATGQIDRFTLHIIGIDESDVKFIFDSSMSESELMRVNEDCIKYLEHQETLIFQYFKENRALTE